MGFKIGDLELADDEKVAALVRALVESGPNEDLRSQFARFAVNESPAA
jgi:hypothetical protein